MGTVAKEKGPPPRKKKKMDAPSQNMNALSVQSLFFVNDEAMHEIDLTLLAKLPETLRMLQEQVSSLSSSSLPPSGLSSSGLPSSSSAASALEVESHSAQHAQPTHATAEVVEDGAPSFTRRARQQQMPQPAAVA
jgi:hypothetical protein